MRQETHPDYDVVTVTCACGNKFQTRSTRAPELSVEICSNCHPFYTGQQKIVDREGRVERFKKRYDEAAAVAAAAPAGGAKKKAVRTPALKKPPKMGKVVPIEVKIERHDDDRRGRGTRGRGAGGGGGRGRGGPKEAPAPVVEGAAEGAAPAAAASAEAPAGGGGESKE